MIEKPLSIWQAGEHFASDERRILFVGKTARSYVGDEESYPFYDTTAWADHAIAGTEPYGAGNWAYWAYTREIIERAFGLPVRDAWERVAFTNLVKCNNGTTIDSTPWECRVNCLQNLQVFKREIEILKPGHIVLYTGSAYDSLLGPALFGNDWEDAPGLGRDFRVACGRKTMPWWEGYVHRADTPTCRVLRTGHPERKNRQEFVNRIVDWLGRK